ncbi:MAG: O-antigen ligase family protein [Anaerolineae bacterium]|nr:MAG: O-antigen ligase family protein [Anaerolineae bacterium]
MKSKALPWLTHRWQDGLLFLALIAGGLALAALPLTLAGLAVVGGTVVVATLVRPEIGLYLLIFAVPFGSLREISLGGMTVGAAEALIGLMLAAWLARLLAYPQETLRWPPLTLSLLIFLGAALLSLPGALSLRYSLKELIKWTEVLGLYVLTTNVLDRRRARTLVFCILLAGTASALHGWYQFFTRSGPEGFLLFGRFMRAYGTFEQPNPYAGYLGLIAPLALSLALPGWPVGQFKGERAKGRGLVEFLFYGGALAAMVAAMAMSRSRGAWLGFAVAAVAVIAARGCRAAAALAALAVVGGLGLALGSLPSAPQALAQPLTNLLPYVRPFDVRGVEVTDANFAVVERMAHWQAGWRMWTEHPWRGVGIGNYEPVYPAYYIPPWKEPLGHAHNTYLNVAAETGLIGLLAYLILWAAAFWQAARAIRHMSGWGRAASIGVLGVLVHLSAHNFFDNLFVHNMYAHVAILLGMLPVLTNVATHRENDTTS